MPRLHELSREDVPLQNVVAWNARVSKGAATLAQTVSVEIPALDGQDFDGARWMPRTITIADVVTVQRPSRGDPCLIVFDEDGDPQIICWWPA